MKRHLKLGILSSTISLGLAGWAGCVGDSSTVDAGPDVSTQDNFVPDTSTKDVVTNDVTDAQPQPNCTPSKPFGPLSLVGALGGADAGAAGARLTNDNLTVYFSVPGPSPNGTIMTASRPNLVASFSTPVPVSVIGSDAGMVGLDPSISPDGLTMYIQFNPLNYVEVRYATRVAADAGFAAPTGVTGLMGNAANHGAPFLEGDNSTLFYSARVSPDGGPTQGGNSIDIFSGAITGPGQFSSVKPEAILNSVLDETSLTITPDGLTAYFARKEGADGGSSGTFHVYTATRGSKIDAFNAPTLVPELDDMPLTNTSPTWISPDNCTIWVQSDRGGPAGAIYSATKPL